MHKTAKLADPYRLAIAGCGQSDRTPKRNAHPARAAYHQRMIDVRYDRGVFLPDLSLWLDPHGPRDFAFVSHAHSDHTGRHRETILTPATARLMAARLGSPVGREHILDFRERLRLRNFEIMLIPAGHVLGSAQCWIGTDAGSLLYTGDFKLRVGLSSEIAEAEPADTLVMETTYGRPQYVFPPTDEVIAQIVKFCVETREDGGTPVLLGYSLGKAQEILSALAGAGIPIMLHGAVWKMTQVYESLGIAFPAYEKYAAGAVAGHALICPPSVAGSAMLRRIPHRRVAMLSGWAINPGMRFQSRADAAFPLSDHAGYDDLLRHVENVRPRRVLTLHGFAQDFARDLRERGIEAWALTGADQLELALPLRRPAPVRPAAREPAAQADSGFGKFTAVCAAIAATTGKLGKTRILAAYLQSLDDADLPLASVWLTGNAFAQTAARPVRAGWAVIRRALLVVSGLSPSDFQAISRRNNDAGLTTFEALAAAPGRANPPLAEIASFFHELETARGPVAKSALLERRLASLPAESARTLVTILTGDLRIGLKEGLVEDALASAFDAESVVLREAHMLLGDLGATALLARHGQLDSATLTPFQAIKCMLASPEPDAASVWSRMTAGGSDVVWLEDKLDGIRAQLHKVDDRVEIYSRDLRRVTGTFPEIAAAAVCVAGDFVLDGEIVAFQDGRPLGFFELQRRLGRKERDLFLASEVPVTFAAFDLLWVNGRSIFRDPLVERRRSLESLAFAPPLTVVPISSVRDATAIDAAFDHARAAGNEGLIAKDPSSRYLPGRRGLAWIKLKKEFATLDVVVVAAEYGHGRRRNVLSDYTFAVRDDSGRLATIGKAYSGLTDAEIRDLTEVFQRTTLRQAGRIFHVRPEVVLEIAFDSVQPSDRHASGYALRFPRIKAIRHDKSVDEIDSVAAARRLAGG